MATCSPMVEFVKNTVGCLFEDTRSTTFLSPSAVIALYAACFVLNLAVSLSIGCSCTGAIPFLHCFAFAFAVVSVEGSVQGEACLHCAVLAVSSREKRKLYPRVNAWTCAPCQLETLFMHRNVVHCMNFYAILIL